MARVLVVDDQASIRLIVCTLLAQAGYEVIEAVNGRDCLQMLLAGARPDVILLDLLMPEMDGPTLLREMEGKIPRLPVVVMSGFLNQFDLQGLSITDTLEKPFQAERLLEAIAEALKGSQEV
jgi:CheY-like chemotaxis protein